MNKKVTFLFLPLLLVFAFCNDQKSVRTKFDNVKNISTFDTTTKTIHVFVALCDNKYQGIVPVPAKIGNGQDPNNNLYWGCGYGIRSYFKKSAEWKLVRTIKKDSLIMERLIFKHVSKNYYLVADAYNGKEIKKCTEDFLSGCAGITKDTLHANGKVIGIAGNSKFLSYIGHDGLMDFDLTQSFKMLTAKKGNVLFLLALVKVILPHI